MARSSRSQRLAPVVRLSAHRQQQAVQAFGQARQLLARHERQLQELRQYRHEYLAQMRDRGVGGLSAASLREFQEFVAQLDRAIAQQEQAVARAAAESDRCRQAWMRTRQDSRAVDEAVARSRAAEGREARRREQRESDDRVPRGRDDSDA